MSKKDNKRLSAASGSLSGLFGRKIGDTERWVYGFLLLFVALFLLLSVVSYYFTWADDQAALRDGVGWSEVDRVANHAGKLGAIAASCMVGRWFGVFALCIPLILLVLALRVMRVRPLFLNKSVRTALMAMILGSLTMGYLFGTRWGAFGTGLGGQTGIAAAEWLSSAIGNVGLGLLLVVGWILLAVYINRRTIGLVNRVGAAVGRSAEGLLNKIPVPSVGDRRHSGDDAGKSLEDDMQAENYYYEPARREDAAPAVAPAAVEEAGATPVSDDRPATEEPDAEDDMFVVEDGARAVEESPFVDDDTDSGEDCFVISDDSPVREEHGFKPPVHSAVGDDFEVIDEAGNRVMASSLRPRPSVETPVAAISADSSAAAADDEIVIGDEPVRPERPAVTLGAGGVVRSDEEGIEVVQTGYEDPEADEEGIDEFRDPTRTLPRYQRPSWVILQDHSVGIRISEEEITANKNIIREKLEDFGIRITDRIKATIGPTVTLYEIEPAQGVKVSRIRNLEEDIALALKVQSIRIITLGQGRGTVGIEVPNSTREIVSMLSIVKSVKFQECQYRLPIVLGKTIYNEIYIGDLTKMPHLLVAGATGQGKSVGLNAIIASLLYKKHPAELKFVLIDPKQVELSLYAKLENHFLARMEGEESAIITDTSKAVNTLNSLVEVMEARYTLLNKAGERNIADYNAKIQAGKLKKRDGHCFMPYIVVVIDEFADMIMTAGRDVEFPITRLAAKARAVGIHLIVATQRPDVKVITGLIKSNIPARIAFKTVSMVDSRTIIDQPGANNLIGMGDMLLYLNGELTRMQCAFLDTPEIENLTDFIAQQQGYDEPYPLPHFELKGNGGGNSGEEIDEGGNMFIQVAQFVVQNRQGSTSAIQRNFRLGYNRAGRIMDKLEKMGIVGRQDGSKPREVIVTDLRQLEDILFDYDEEELRSI